MPVGRDYRGRFISLSFSGTKEMARKFRGLAKATPEMIGAALRQETEIEAKEAKRRTPVDTGALRGTIHADGPFWRSAGRFVYSSINAGGPAAPYAVYVHENLEAYHKVGQAKFIESVILESAPHIAARVAQRLRQAMAKEAR